MPRARGATRIASTPARCPRGCARARRARGTGSRRGRSRAGRSCGGRPRAPRRAARRRRSAARRGQREHLDLGLLGDLGRLARGGVAGLARARVSSGERRLVDEQVGAVGDRADHVAGRGVAGDDDLAAAAGLAQHLLGPHLALAPDRLAALEAAEVGPGLHAQLAGALRRRSGRGGRPRSARSRSPASGGAPRTRRSGSRRARAPRWARARPAADREAFRRSPARGPRTAASGPGGRRP